MSKNDIRFELSPLPRTEIEAVQWLLPLLDKNADSLREISSEEFKKAWYSIGFLYSGLHPDGALEHGARILASEANYPEVTQIEPRLANPYYEESGWPLVLAPIAAEAWRRYEAGDFTDEEFYCSEAQMAGMCHQSPALAKKVAFERACWIQKD